MQRCYYHNSSEGFLAEPQYEILGKLTQNHGFDLNDLQRNAWLAQIHVLKNQLHNIPVNQVFFEFAIPRMGRRVDNIVLLPNAILVLEFKVGATHYTQQAKNQTIDYCLDLLNFHAESHGKKVIPVLVCTQAPAMTVQWALVDQLQECVCCNQDNLNETLLSLVQQCADAPLIDADKWQQSAYKPTPTIIEAAQALYKQHQVGEITRHDAGATNLAVTSARINHIIEEAKQHNNKVICFLTGVPGAGKTLAGLNIANERLHADENEHAVFLSGNGPLVSVLREALVRDAVAIAKEQGLKLSKNTVQPKTQAFIQNIHHFRDEYVDTDAVPLEKVVVFDEAQRAWDKEQASAFMQQKKGKADFKQSEPEFLIEVMNRHQGWCVVVCLIGGGQEINKGEAGISEWIAALQTRFTDWSVHYSAQIEQQAVYLSSEAQKAWLRAHAHEETELHLAVSVRSFRSEAVAQYVECVLAGLAAQAQDLYPTIEQAGFLIRVTRDLNVAKQWLRQQARGTERYGLIASSGGRRLRPEGIDVKNKIDPVYWFLNPDDDVRSAYYLEDVATEFDVQGLEIDYACVAWDINLYYQRGWRGQFFTGSSWKNIVDPWKQKYLFNAYRVLLTRARQGMVIYVPEVDGSDHTRSKQAYDDTYDFLRACGVKAI